MNHVTYKGIRIDDVDYDLVRERIREQINQKKYVSLIETLVLTQATRDPELSKALNESFITISDGTPLFWYGRLLGCKNLRRISGGYLFKTFLEKENDFKHFLLGDTEERISGVIEKARRVNPDIQISGYEPPFKEVFSPEDNTRIFDRINSENPDIIWVSLGGIKQDKWMHKNYRRLNRGVMIGVGAAFKYYLGELITPPNIIQKLGLQCLYRIMQERARHTDQWTFIYRSIFIRISCLFSLASEIYKTRKNGSLG